LGVEHEEWRVQRQHWQDDAVARVEFQTGFEISRVALLLTLVLKLFETLGFVAGWTSH